jgi:hypothetical protein
MTEADQNATPPREDKLPWARQSIGTHREPLTDRARRMVHGLPSWEPLPPGEILVNRHGRD